MSERPGVLCGSQLQKPANTHMLPSLDDTSEAVYALCEQRAQMWQQQQAAARQQFETLLQLYAQLEQLLDACGGAAAHQYSPARARLAVRLGSCTQLHEASFQLSTSLAGEVQQQLSVMTSQLQRYSAMFASVAALTNPPLAACCAPLQIVSAVRDRVHMLVEQVSSLENDIKKVSEERDSAEDRLCAALETHPAELRLKELAAEHTRRREDLNARLKETQQKTTTLSTQLEQEKDTAAAARLEAASQLWSLQQELENARDACHTAQQHLDTTRAQLTDECEKLRTQQQSMTTELDHYKRLDRLHAQRLRMEKSVALKALDVLNADRDRLMRELSTVQSQLIEMQTSHEADERRTQRQTHAHLIEMSESVDELRSRLRTAERRLTEAEAKQRDSGAALRQALATRSKQLDDANAQLLSAKRTIVQQEVRIDFLEQHVRGSGGAALGQGAARARHVPTHAQQQDSGDASAGAETTLQLPHTRTSPPRRVQELESQCSQLRVDADQQRRHVRQLTAGLEEAGKTTDMLRIELKVALQALQQQRQQNLRHAQTCGKMQEVAGEEQRCRELGSLSTRWQKRAEAAERHAAQLADCLKQEQRRRNQIESSLVQASSKIRNIQLELEKQDQCSSWAELNKSLQSEVMSDDSPERWRQRPGSAGAATGAPAGHIRGRSRTFVKIDRRAYAEFQHSVTKRLAKLKQVETVMLALLKVAPAGGQPAAAGGAVCRRAGAALYDPPTPRSILRPVRRRWSAAAPATPDQSPSASSAGSLAASDAETEGEPHTEVSLAAASAAGADQHGRLDDEPAPPGVVGSSESVK